MNLLKELKKQANKVYLQAMSTNIADERNALLQKYKEAKCKYYRHKVWLENLKSE